MNNQELFVFNELLLHVLEGDASDEDNQRLNRILLENPTAIEHYLDHIDIRAEISRYGGKGLITPIYEEPVAAEDDILKEVIEQDLFDTAARKAIEDAETRRVETEEALLKNKRPIKPRFGRQEVLRGLIWVAAVVVVALGIIWLDRQLYRQESPDVVARLTAVENGRWMGLAAPAVGGDITEGPLELQQGLAELTFANGAKVIMEAPARVNLRQDDELYLELGKVTIVASGSAIGFVVNTDNARVVDLGTEFGVAADVGGTTEVQVYQGEVALIPDWKQNRFQANAASRVKLAKGQARRVNVDHSVVKIPHSDVAFVRPEEFAVRQQAGRGDAYARWRAWSYQVRRDPDLVVYYPFEKNINEPDTLFNYAAGTFGRMNGQLSTGEAFGAPPVWVTGRWPGKSALQFNRDQGGRVVTPADMEFCLTGDITIAVWLCCSEQIRGGHILSNRQEYNVNYQISLGDTQNGRNPLQFARYISDIGSDKPKAYTQTPFDFSDKWHFLTFTYENNVVRYYIDGALYEAVPYLFVSPSPALAELVIGDVSESVPIGYSKRRFNGLMDEIAIFRRILMPEEIQTMYNAGKPE